MCRSCQLLTLTDRGPGLGKHCCIARHGNEDGQAATSLLAGAAGTLGKRAKAPQHPMKLEKRKKEGGWVEQLRVTSCAGVSEHCHTGQASGGGGSRAPLGVRVGPPRSNGRNGAVWCGVVWC